MSPLEAIICDLSFFFAKYVAAKSGFCLLFPQGGTPANKKIKTISDDLLCSNFVRTGVPNHHDLQFFCIFLNFAGIKLSLNLPAYTIFVSFFAFRARPGRILLP